MTKLVQLIIIIILPIIISLSIIRLLPSSFFLEYEYGKKDFPEDQFGFTQEERIELAKTGLAFLKSSAKAQDAIQILKNQTYSKSQQTLYNDRELSHLIDVKNIFSTINRLIVQSLLVISIATAYLLMKNRKKEIIQAVILGGMFTTTSTLLFLGLIILNWESFFLSFHKLMFTPDSWTFNETDTLIRLYPEKFWFDFGMTLTILILFESIIIASTGYLILKRSNEK